MCENVKLDSVNKYVFFVCDAEQSWKNKAKKTPKLPLSFRAGCVTVTSVCVSCLQTVTFSQLSLLPPVRPLNAPFVLIHPPPILCTRPSFSAASTHPSAARCGPSCCTTTATTPPRRRERPGGCRSVLTIVTSNRGGGQRHLTAENICARKGSL